MKTVIHFLTSLTRGPRLWHAALGILWSVSFLGIAPVKTLHAQAKGESSPLLHIPVRSKDLPAPGAAMKLSFRLKNQNLAVARARAVVVRDGKLFDLGMKEAAINDQGAIGYLATMYAPLVELKYQFLITTRDGEVISSPLFAARRSCVPDITLAEIGTDTTADVQTRLERLVSDARSIEKDLKAYDSAATVLDDLISMMEEGK